MAEHGEEELKSVGQKTDLRMGVKCFGDRPRRRSSLRLK
jgi:hypothetical protein